MLELPRESRVRLRCFQFYLRQNDVALTCRHFGIARSTFLRWAMQFDVSDVHSLEERSRRPKHVRKPETSEKVIALIRRERERDPLISKTAISEKLQRDHEIVLSSASVGREIHRHGFYFAKTPSHISKRAEFLRKEADAQASSDYLVGGSSSLAPAALSLFVLALSTKPTAAHAQVLSVEPAAEKDQAVRADTGFCVGIIAAAVSLTLITRAAKRALQLLNRCRAQVRRATQNIHPASTISRWMPAIVRSISFAVGCTVLLIAGTAAAANSGPQRFVYNGHLFDSEGNAITTQHTIRFSFWTSADYLSSDVTASGAINTGASSYASWQETQSITPDSNGYFTVQMGSGTQLPNFASYTPAQLAALHLQVEVKASSDSNTSYELLDANGDNDAVDRSPMLSVPFAQNANLLDQRDVGTGSGSIPLLQSGGLLSVGAMPGGTNRDRFTIDANSSSGSIALRFGESLSKELSYDQANGWFNFNDDVHIQGNLTVSGLINGIDLASIVSGATSLKVSSGAGLNVNIGAGSYRLQGNTTNYSGGSNLAVVNNATNYIFFTGTGVQLVTGGFPTTHSAIQLAEVVTAGGAITSVTDRRVTLSDDREITTEKDYHAAFEHATAQGDATNNVGQLSIDHDNVNLRNFYKWTSTSTALQDYDLIVRMTLPTEFVRWGSGALAVTYRSTSASSGNNAMDISVFDTNGSPVSLSGGSSTTLVSASWSTTIVNFGSTSTWTPGQDFLLKFKMYAKDNFQMQLGDIKIKYVNLPKE